MKETLLTRKKPVIRNGKIENDIEMFAVRIMAIAEGYAMVRRKGCLPFVCTVKELTAESQEKK